MKMLTSALLAVAVAASAHASGVWTNVSDTESNVKTGSNWEGGSAPAFNNSAAPSDVVFSGTPEFLQTVQWDANHANSVWYAGLVSGGSHRRIALANGNGRQLLLSDASGFGGYFCTMGAFNALYCAGDAGTCVTAGQAAVTGRMNLRSQQSGAALTVGRVFGTGFFDVNRTANDGVSNAGTVEIGSNEGGLRAGLRVNGGSLVLHGVRYDAPEMVGDPFIHLDASSGVETEESDGRVLVSRWNDVRENGLYAAPDSSLSRPFMDGGCVNFGSYVGKYGAYEDSNTHEATATETADAGPAGWLRLSSARTDVREAFFVFRDNARYGHNAQVFGAPDGEKDVFERTCKWISNVGYLVPNLFKTGPGTAEIAAGDVRIDGARIEGFSATGFKDSYQNQLEIRDFSDRLHVVSVGLDGTAAIDRIAAGSHGAGGITIAEVVIYTNALTSAQRRQVNAFLRAKWQSAEEAADLDLADLEFRNAPSALDVAEGTLRVGSLSVGSYAALTKRGGGTLVAVRAPDVASVTVEAGEIAFANGGTTETGDATEPAARPDVWFDATAGTSYDKVDGTGDYEGVSWAKNWRDVRDGTNACGFRVVAECDRVARSDGTDWYGDWPVLAEGPFGRTVLDFGDGHDATAFAGFSQRSDVPDDRPASASFEVRKASTPDGTAKTTQQAGVQRMFFAAVKRKHATAVVFGGEAFSPLLAELNGKPNSGVLDPYQAYGVAHGGAWTLNGGAFDPSSEPFPTNEWMVVGLEMPVAVSMSRIADRGTRAGLVGGLQIGEILAYDRVLTAAERRRTETYLVKRWVDASYEPESGNDVAIGAMSFGSGASAVLSFDGDATIGSVAAEGTLVKKGEGSVTVTENLGSGVTGIDVQGGSLSVSLSPADPAAEEPAAALGIVSVAEGASLSIDSGEAPVEVGTMTLDVHFDAEGRSNAPAFAGKLKLPATATVRVSADDGVAAALLDGKPIVSAGAIEGSVEGWTLDASGLPENWTPRLAVRGGSVVLRVVWNGMLILFR